VKPPWATQRLGELRAETKHALVGGPFGSNLVSRDYSDEGIPVIRGCNLPDNAPFSFDDLVFVSERKADALRPNNAFPGDLIFTQRGTLGQVGVIPKDSPYSRFIISQSQMKLAVHPDRAEARYLYYYFRLPSTVERIQSLAISSGVPHINLNILRKFQVITPPVPIQRRISAVLSAYDELIENQRRRIALLEQLVDEVYREWFVRLRFPGHQKANFIKSMPRDWPVKKLGELVRTQYGYTASAETEGDGPKFLRITDIVPFAINWELVPHCKIDEKDEEKYLLREGDIVVARTGATFGYAKRINKRHPKAIFASYLVRLIPKRTGDAIFLGLSIERSTFKEFVRMFDTGAAQPQANATTMALFPILYPPEPLLIEFNQIVEPILDEKELLLDQVATLSRTRDSLLPRLISGKLSVENLDIQFPPGMAQELRVEPLALAHA
jgi:type I restriction enzyme S subunit